MQCPIHEIVKSQLQIHEFLSNETPLYLLGITKRFCIEKFHLIKPKRFLDLLEKVGLVVGHDFF